MTMKATEHNYICKNCNRGYRRFGSACNHLERVHNLPPPQQVDALWSWRNTWEGGWVSANLVRQWERERAVREAVTRAVEVAQAAAEAAWAAEADREADGQ